MPKPRSPDGPRHDDAAAARDLEALSAPAVEGSASLSEILESLDGCGFGARELGRAWRVLTAVADTPSCGVVLTLSGAMTVAKMGTILGALVDRGFVHAVVTTGALVTHSLVEEAGMQHYKAPAAPDGTLFKLGMNRIHDSVELEANLQRLEALAGGVYASFEEDQPAGSAEIVDRLSAALTDWKSGSGLLAAARRRKVPVFIPALPDSEIGLYLYRRHRSGLRAPRFDPMLDLEAYERRMSSRRRLAFFTVGGGVPRNWAQQMLPFLKSLPGPEHNGRLPRVVGAVRICPDPVSPGHLSGSSYSEGITWGKFPSDSIHSLVDVHADATVVLPFLGRALVEYLDAKARPSADRRRVPLAGRL